MSTHPKQEIYDEAEVARNKQTNDILSSPARKKIVVAGPGTGKTHLFRELLRTRSRKSLTLTFINALVDELSLSLLGLSEVRTLHGYALSVLQQKGYKLYPRLPDVIQEDAQTLGDRSMVFKSLFQEEPINEKERAFYEKRRDYYGKYYGFPDIIHALVEYYKHPENSKEIPIYEQVVVDEFQDFNKFEVDLIELLATKSPILITGDDDQSLYMGLKKASPEHIRRKHRKEGSEYVSFPLSYCSRSTEVIVGAINDFISTATEKGLLKGRVDKKYVYFPSKDMDEEGLKHPKIVFRPVYANFLSEFLRDELSEIAAQEKKSFSLLIIVPNPMKNTRFPQIINSLQSAGLRNILHSDKSDKSPSIMDALSLMQEDPDTNLGWRILLKAILQEDEFESILKRTQSEPDKRISTIAGDTHATKIRRLFDAFQRLIKDESVKEQELKELFSVLGYDPLQLGTDKFRKDFFSSKSQSPRLRALKNIKVQITTILGSKGLAADYVFLVDFSDRYFSTKGTITDQNIYDFLVAITRARKQIYLISPDDKEATFLSWVETKRVDRQRPFLKKKFAK